VKIYRFNSKQASLTNDIESQVRGGSMSETFQEGVDLYRNAQDSLRETSAQCARDIVICEEECREKVDDIFYKVCGFSLTKGGHTTIPPGNRCNEHIVGKYISKFQNELAPIISVCNQRAAALQKDTELNIRSLKGAEDGMARNKRAVSILPGNGSEDYPPSSGYLEGGDDSDTVSSYVSDNSNGYGDSFGESGGNSGGDGSGSSVEVDSGFGGGSSLSGGSGSSGGRSGSSGGSGEYSEESFRALINDPRVLTDLV